MRIFTTLTLAALVAFLVAAEPVAADVAGPTLTMKVNGSNQQVVLNDGQLLWHHTGSSKGLYIEDLTLNPATGTVYALIRDPYTLSYGGVIGLDPDATSTPDSPSSAAVVRVGLDPDTGAVNADFDEPGDTGLEYPGAVKGTSGQTVEIEVATVNQSLGFNPNWSKGASAGSLVQGLGPTSIGSFKEFSPQTAAVDWGELQEGSVGSEVRDAGVFSSFSASAYGSGGWQSRALAYLDRREVDSATMDRWLHGFVSNSTGAALYIAHSGTAVTGADNDTQGSRSASRGEFLDLGSIISGSLADVAIRPGTSGDVFDVYLLANDGGVSKLFAIRATIPTTGSITYETIDLDAESVETWLQLTDSVADADIGATGVVFSADGNTLYAAGTLALDTGHGGSGGTDDARVYIYDATQVPEPATLALLGLGGLMGLTGLARRRRA